MNKEDYSVIDTTRWEPIQSPGLRAARHQLAYDSQQIQVVLSEAFSTMFPSIVDAGNKVKRYQSINSGGKDVFGDAVPAKNISDIPRAETMRLMEGWIRLRRKLQEENHPDNVTAILLNFRVPNPRQSLDRYMIYKKGDETRLIIRWGYETNEEKAVSLERAISILMDVPLGHMRSILSTTMSQTTSTVPVGPLLAAEEARESLERSNAAAKKASKLPVLAAVAVFTVLLGGVYGFGLFEGEVDKENAVDSTYVFMPELDEREVNVVEAEEPEELKPEEIEPIVSPPKTVVVDASEAAPDMEALMDDLVVKNTEVKETEQTSLSLDSMMTESDSSQGTMNLIGEMMQ